MPEYVSIKVEKDVKDKLDFIKKDCSYTYSQIIDKLLPTGASEFLCENRMEDPAFRVYFTDENNNFEKAISWKMLRESEVDDEFTSDLIEDSLGYTELKAKVIEKDDDGIVILFKKYEYDKEKVEWLERFTFL